MGEWEKPPAGAPHADGAGEAGNALGAAGPPAAAARTEAACQPPQTRDSDAGTRSGGVSTRAHGSRAQCGMDMSAARMAQCDAASPPLRHARSSSILSLASCLLSTIHHRNARSSSLLAPLLYQAPRTCGGFPAAGLERLPAAARRLGASRFRRAAGRFYRGGAPPAVVAELERVELPLVVVGRRAGTGLREGGELGERLGEHADHLLGTSVGGAQVLGAHRNTQPVSHRDSS